MSEKSYLVLAYYRFTPLKDPHDEILKHKNFFNDKDATGRIYISEEGINCQMSGESSVVRSYMEWMNSDPRFEKQRYLLHNHHENIFPRMTIKYRAQLVALDEKVDPNEGGEHVSPEKWKEMLESGEEVLLLDVRNAYETEIGHFENSVLPPLEKFRDFPAYADRLKNEVDPEKTKVMMCCTGGIRCELYSALMKKRGFKQIYQLDGGIINYGLKTGNKHWKGKLFVFDDRMAVPIDDSEVTPISKCVHCQKPSDTHYNCAHMDCNNLYLCCTECREGHKGACSPTCEAESAKLRPLDKRAGNKPFRRKHLISKD
jgi:UPF0176 protein